VCHVIAIADFFSLLSFYVVYSKGPTGGIREDKCPVKLKASSEIRSTSNYCKKAIILFLYSITNQ
jgi:hypothetical protein